MECQQTGYKLEHHFKYYCVSSVFVEMSNLPKALVRCPSEMLDLFSVSFYGIFMRWAGPASNRGKISSEHYPSTLINKKYQISKTSPHALSTSSLAFFHTAPFSKATSCEDLCHLLQPSRGENKTFTASLMCVKQKPIIKRKMTSCIWSWAVPFHSQKLSCRRGQQSIQVQKLLTGTGTS